MFSATSFPGKKREDPGNEVGFGDRVIRYVTDICMV